MNLIQTSACAVGCPQWRSPVKQQNYMDLGRKVCNGCWTDLTREDFAEGSVLGMLIRVVTTTTMPCTACSPLVLLFAMLLHPEKEGVWPQAREVEQQIQTLFTPQPSPLPFFPFLAHP